MLLNGIQKLSSIERHKTWMKSLGKQFMLKKTAILTEVLR